MIENFDIINIEYMENGEETFDYPEEMLVSVETRKDDSIDHTKDSIRAKIKSYIRRNFGNDVEVVDFLAFPVGSDIQLGQLSFEFDAETFEAREKKIGSIRIVKNPNFPSGTHLQGYIKTNRAELRKVFGNPNMGESGDGKSKGKEWNLVVGGKRVTIYDRREMGKKGTKYFNIGGDGKYSALLVAQALSIHRNERVHAKEITPKWLEDERRHEMVQSIDDYPDLTYERAKEYEDNRRRYRAETFEGIPQSVSDLEAVEDVRCDKYELEVNFENEDMVIVSGEELKAIMDDGWDLDSVRSFEDAGMSLLFTRNPNRAFEAEEDYVDYTMWIYTKSTGGIFSGEWEDGESEEQVVKEWKELVREAIEQHGDDLITADLRKHSNYDEDGVAQSSEFLFQYEHGEDNLDDFEAEDDLTFKEWADQEMMTHGGRESFDDWLNDELKSHGDDITLSDWGHHELDSHYERYGSEALDYEDRLKLLYEDFLANWEKENPDSDNPPSFDEWTDLVMEQNPAMFDAEGFRTMGGRGFQIEFKNGYTISVMFGEGSYGDHYNDPDFDYEDSREYLESSQAEVAIRKPNGQIMLEILGWTSPDFVAALIPVVATGDEAEMIEVIQNREHREAESFEDFKRKMVGDGAVAGDVGYMEALEEFYEDYLEDFERITDEFCPEPETFEEFQERVLKNDYEMSLEAENWGGDPKGKLATALRNARIKAKQPKKPLKIEKLDAEGANRYWIKKVKFNMKGENDDYKRKMIQKFGKDGIFTSTKAAKKDFDEMVKQAVNLTNTAYVNGKQIPYPYDEKTVATARAKWNDNPPSRYGKKMNSVTAQGVICWVEYYPMVKLGAETFNADVKMDNRAWVSYYDFNFMNVRPENPENITGDSKMVSFRDYRKELYGVYLTTQEAKKAFNLLKGSLLGRGNWKDGQYEQVIYGYKQIYGGSKTIPVEMKFEYVPIRRFGYDTAMHTKTKNAETSGQWEIGEQLEEAQMNAEGKKRKKLSGQLSDPFDELSLDSGDWKGIVIGFSVGLLGLFGYSKLRK